MTGPIEAPSRMGGWAALTAATLLLVFLAGCATSAQTGGDPGVERYPAALIAAAEPVAPAVGFVLSRVRWRGGYLRGRDDVLEHLARQLKPLDIMLLTNKGQLSGRSGPGLFSHAAVYVGNEQQLRRNGLWNQVSVVPHQEALRRGRTIIESEQRHGTSLSTLLQANDSDRIVILRPRDRGASWRRQATSSLLASVGIAFDHRFRLDDKIAIFCTQLVDMAMPELNLPRRTAYGREIILPDDIATKAMHGNCLSVVSYVRADENGWEAVGARELSADIREAWSGMAAVSAFAKARPTSHASVFGLRPPALERHSYGRRDHMGGRQSRHPRSKRRILKQHGHQDGRRRVRTRNNESQINARLWLGKPRARVSAFLMGQPKPDRQETAPIMTDGNGPQDRHIADCW